MSGAARLRSLAVRDFRNLARLDLAFPSEGLVLIGENGQGKTNLLEAVYYLELLRSGRGARDQDVARFGAPGFYLAASMDTDREHEITVGFERATRRKRVRVDGAEPERLSDALGTLPAVMFSPADVELVAGAPSARRRYLDIMLALTSRAYLYALQRYRTALAHRNAALREAARAGGGSAGGGSAGGRGHDARIAVWEAPLAEFGAVLVTARRAWVDGAAAHFERLCRAIGEAGRVTMRYAGTIAAEGDARASLAAGLEEKRPLDIRRGVTHVGPHRDDLVIALAGPDGTARDLRAFGSAGQQRTAAIALRMLEAQTLCDRRGGAPVFLLDDPFAELDARRSARIMGLLEDSGLGQTVLAVPRESDIPPGLTRLERRRVAAGEVLPWGAAEAVR